MRVAIGLLALAGFAALVYVMVSALIAEDWAQAAAWTLLLCWGELARMNLKKDTK